MLITNKVEDIETVFKQGGVFAYPTESVFGLGCDPDNDIAINKLLGIKERSIHKGLILIASDFSQVEKYLQPILSSQIQFTKASETTYIFPALTSTSTYLTGDFNSLAIRITTHPLVRSLCAVLGSAIVSTSANTSGQPPAMSVEAVSIQLDHKIDALLDGELGNLSKPTQIRDSISGEIIRL